MSAQPPAERLVEVVPLGGAPGRYTYAVPAPLSEQITVGRRVVVPFGTQPRVGVVVRDAAERPATAELRPVTGVLDDLPLLLPEVLGLCEWAAEYYLAPLSHAVRAALPPGAPGEAHETLQLTEAGRTALETGGITAATRRALRAVASGEQHLLAASLRSRLAREGLLERTRELSPGGLAPTLTVLSATESGEAVPERHRVLHGIATRVRERRRVPLEEITREWPQSASAVRRLAERGIVRVEQLPREALPETVARETPPQLTAEQDAALRLLESEFAQNERRPVLVEGVTGSGKTEVYLRLIQRAREAGGNALVLVPEIALTPQLAARFRARFGPDVAVLHSGLTDSERNLEWHRIRRGRAPIVVGARSAVFAPLERPAVIIVDEEHDPSFKQESGLRYHGRDLAVVRGKLAGALVVLGSATPSLESSWNVVRGKYLRARLPSRVDDRPMPDVQLVDLRGRARGKAEAGVAPSGLLSEELVQALRDTVAAGDQAIVFLNRRGHSTALLCRDCGDVRRCPDCAVAYTWHQRRGRLICHYCGRREPAPDTCGNCGSTRLLFTGAGTEKLEAEVATCLPGARLARLDRDTAGNTRKLTAILDRFARRELDVLVGTQMVTKGHDFPGVTLVCVLFADASLHQPDFRSAERTAQLLTQVAGRAGRGERPGRVLVQTFAPEAGAVAAVVGHDYGTFARHELQEREDVRYPPFCRLCLLRVESESEEDAERHARALAATCRTGFAGDVLGSAPAPLPRLRGKFRFQILLKADRHSSLTACVRRALAAVRPPGSVHVTVDIDPVDMG